MHATIPFDRDALVPAVADLEKWPAADPSVLDDNQAKTFYARERAVRAYFGGSPIDQIEEETGIGRQELRRLAKRCLRQHDDGEIWGFRALVPYIRQKTYKRTAAPRPTSLYRPAGNSGALMQLFRRHPDIQTLVDHLFLKRPNSDRVNESRTQIKSIHKDFLDACREQGISASAYPFCTKWLGYSALSRYLRRLLKKEMIRAVRVRLGADAARRLKTGLGGPGRAQPERPYERVEFDGHRIDVLVTVLIPNAFGGTVPLILERLWLLVVKECLSRAIIGYYVCIRPEYNADDVLQCIKQSIVPWKPRELTIPGLRYAPESGLPSYVIPELAYALWDELRYDNAKANLSTAVRTTLTDVVDCAVNAGPVNNPERRALIERFFQTFEENGFHRLPSTTGSGPDDPRRQNPEKQALHYGITLEHLEELTDVIIAQYNATPHAGIGHRTPLEMLQYFVNADPSFIRALPERKRGKLALFDQRAVRTVRGNLEDGRRPHVEFEGVRYYNMVLSRSPGLIGQKLVLYVNRQDLRSIRAFLKNGNELGALTAQGFWGRTPHTLEMRKAINSLRHRKLISYTENDDPIHVYLEHLAQSSHSNKRDRAKYVNATRAVETDKTSGIHQPPTKPEPGAEPAPQDNQELLELKGISF